MTDAPPVVVVCQGPPRCDFDIANADTEAADRRMATCPWCTRITVHPDGSETIEEPANA